MSTISDFYRIEDCDKTPAECIDAYVEMYLDEESPVNLKLDTSWGNSVVDLTPAIKAGETLTTMYLSPSTSPNCLVYEPERGDNICIHGNDLSRIISMRYLKDVDQSTSPETGDVYMLGNNGLFQPYSLQTFIDNTNASITNLRSRMSAAEANITNLQTRMAAAEANIAALQATVANHESRLAAIEALLVKPTGAPNDAKIAWGTINVYSDTNATIDPSGAATSLDKTHGLYTHNLNTEAYGDELFG